MQRENYTCVTPYVLLVLFVLKSQLKYNYIYIWVFPKEGRSAEPGIETGDLRKYIHIYLIPMENDQQPLACQVFLKGPKRWKSLRL